jgi:RNA polymerase sigma factor (sigma-70 family)
LETITRIIRGCMDKDHKYQQIIYERYRGYALKIVFRYIYRYERAADVVNDGFVKLFHHFDKFKPGAEADNEKILMGWMKKIMVNVAIDELRRGNMLPEIGGIPEYVWETSDKGQEADQLLLYKDLISLVKELPPQYRVIFNMYVIDGYSHVEIAGKLKISIGTSKSSLSRSRVFLQKSIKKLEENTACNL